MTAVDDEDEEEEEDDDDDDDDIHTKSRSIDYILRRPTIVNSFAGNEKLGNGISRVWAKPMPAKRPREEDEEEEINDDCDVKVACLERRRGRGRGRGKGVILELAAEIRAFSERLVGMESMKMEIIKDTERCRREMETKRIEMILRSQNKIVDSITRAFGLE